MYIDKTKQLKFGLFIVFVISCEI